MAVTVEALRDYTEAPAGDGEFLSSCIAEAVALVTRHVGSTVIPAEIVDRATLGTAAELYYRRNAPSGMTQFATPDGQGMRLARDPMQSSYPLLAPWLGPVIA